jgi:hypothetical protein
MRTYAPKSEEKRKARVNRMKKRYKYYYHYQILEDGRGAYRVLIGKAEEKMSPKRLGVDWRMILKWILKKYGEFCALDTFGSECRPVANSCKAFEFHKIL